MTIDLIGIDPRFYLFEVDRQLANGGRASAAERIRAAHPRDLAEVFVLLPDDVAIKLWEVSDEAHDTARSV